MKKWKKVLKWLGIGLGVLVMVLGVALGGAYAMSGARMDAHYEIAGRSFDVPSDEAAITEGRRIFMSRGCGECHGEDARGRVLIDIPLMRIAPPNLTTMASTFSEPDWDRAVRHGVSPTGRPYVLMPAHELWYMSDADLGRVVAYLRSLPASPSELPANEIRLIGRVLHVLGAMPVVPAELVDHDAPRPTPPAVAETVAYGEYLHWACINCHGEHMSGGPMPGAPEDVMGIPANLTFHETGLRGWTREDLYTLMQTGRRPDGTSVNPEHMPVRISRHYTELEVGALYLYLRSLPERPFGER